MISVSFSQCELSIGTIQKPHKYDPDIRFCKFVLRNDTGYHCTRKENKRLKKIFQLHPRWKDKEGAGFSFVTVQMSCYPPAKCFFIHRKDGTKIDISYRKCLRLPGRDNRVGCDGTKIQTEVAT